MDDLLPLLNCPLCPGNPLLTLPTTLRCGHSLCLAHFTPAALHACPVPSCSMAATDHFVQNNSRVLLLPPRGQPSLPRLPHPTTDFTLAKILTLVNARPLRSHRRPVTTPPNSGDEGDAPGSDVESADAVCPRRRNTDTRNDDRSHPVSPPRKRRRRHSPGTVDPRSSPGAPPDHSETLAKEICQELNCEICYMLFLRPVTTPCQHTFCAKCLQRSLDHSDKCPICRQELPPYSYFHDQGVNKVILSIILKLCPANYTERQTQQELEERDGRLRTPIFVCQLSFPGVPTLLHFFEPRYRLMLRRCLEQPTPAFGMIMPPAAGATIGPRQSEYGTMLEIRSVQMLPDGRSMVETWGTYRFRMLERGTLDGYVVGRIEKVVDFDEEEEDLFTASQPSGRRGRLDLQPSNEELMAVCHSFLDKLRNGMAPWVVQRLNHTYGPEPKDLGLFTFWMALILPIDEREKAKLLPIRSPRLRLRLLVHWIEQLNSQWWFSNGCVVS